MSWENDDAFGGFWDGGYDITSDLISYPINRIISRDAARSGIDINDPFRRTASFASSAFLGTVFSTFLGPLGGAIGGIMGHIIGLAAEREGESEGSDRRARLNEFTAMRLKAMDLATDVLKAHVSSDMWHYLQNRMSNDLDQYVNSWAGANETMENCYRFLDGIENTILSSIRSVDYDIYSNFSKVYSASKSELNIR